MEGPVADGDATLIIGGRVRSVVGLEVAAIALPRLSPAGDIQRYTLRLDPASGQPVRRADIAGRACVQLCASAKKPESPFLALPGEVDWSVIQAPATVAGGIDLTAVPTGLQDHYHGFLPLPDPMVLTLPAEGGELGRAGDGTPGRLVVGLLTQPGSLVLTGADQAPSATFIERVGLSRRHLHIAARRNGRIEVRMAQGSTPAWHLRDGQVIATLPLAGQPSPSTSLAIEAGLVGPYLFRHRHI
ncbi:hypothetical protein FBZ87_1132 [Nitrospirillum amazonense]|uniref:Uncharacterized protein n=1 Tax=Nitrospirillum amazonense TaxID=28077 RepID=A0A560JHD2_9PROT|nr:hypothetical protein [Nitrospirillum amazonense]TWB67760.1 hypothetical protein FBZ87_1132 [Nitrospirillum amazonense]